VNPWPIAPVAASDLYFAVVAYDFTSLTGEETSQEDPLLDALDLVNADFATSIADQTVLIASMANDLDDLGKVLNEIATDDFEAIAADLAGIAAAGDGILTDFAKLF
jgi:hypothetical protein